MYQASVPVLSRGLTNLQSILRKAQQHAQTSGYDAEVLLQARLYPDMFPLLRQVQIACDTAKFAAERLAGAEPRRFEDNEVSFEQVLARVQAVVDYLGTFGAAQIDGSETRTVVVPSRSGERTFDGRGYLLGFVLPNLHFHTSIVYALLRHNGVPLGKLDYLGAR